MQEKFICCSRNCTKSLGEGIYGIWGTFVAKDGHEWLPKSSKFAATLKPRHQGDAGPISLQDKGENMLRIGSILTPKSRSDPENTDNPKCANPLYIGETQSGSLQVMSLSCQPPATGEVGDVVHFHRQRY